MVKQEIVIKVSMNGAKSRPKAMKTAAKLPGIESVALKGEDKDQIVVTGDGIDSIVLTKLLRKKFGFAELVSVAAIGKEEEKNKESAAAQVLPIYQMGVPQYYVYDAYGSSCDPYCNIMWITSS